ncbi:MAG: hypothetical protein HZB43_07330 [candidate division Zixibacteria bacterium]|nr:hypothetical protein [candidate division Zixibacteria bacterium]
MSDAQGGHNKDERSRLVGGIIVGGIGMVFLLSNLDVIPRIGRMWPLFLVVIGFALLVGAMRGRGGSDTGSSSS